MKAIEEYAIEYSIIKVYGSEVLDYVADEGVQIHGGYGFHQDYAVERAYRDSQINRIFEGTNEINRLLITGMLLKRAMRGQLGLVAAAQSLLAEVASGRIGATDSDEEIRLVRNAKSTALLMMGMAFQKYAMELEHQQEILMSLADIVMEAFAMESVLLRTRKLGASRSGVAQEMCSVFLRDAMGPSMFPRVTSSARAPLRMRSDSICRFFESWLYMIPLIPFHLGRGLPSGFSKGNATRSEMLNQL